MFVSKISVNNYRLLQNVELCLDKKTTVIVGRNNSGKTSLTDLFRRLSKDKSPGFKLEDFSLGVHGQFWRAFELVRSGAEDKDVRDALPTIDIALTIDYHDSGSDFGPLNDFVVDLDAECFEARIRISYALEDGKINAFFDRLSTDRREFYKELKERIPALFRLGVEAQDPNDPSNTKTVDLSQMRALLQFGFISAHRSLDDAARGEKAVIGKVLEALFMAATKDTADPSGRNTAEQLKYAVSEIEDRIDNDFNTELLKLIPAFTMFGYPGLTDPKLHTETALKVETLLSNHTTMTYEGSDGVNLPESYNGLGPRNLIFILLKILEFFRAFTSTQPSAGVSLIFIEEPEAHLHPQMQNVFVRKIGEIAALFSREYNEGRPWPVQFVVTTHSSHIANEAAFDSMRYFLAHPISTRPGIFATEVRDLCSGLGAEERGNREFLHKYMTLTRCDLLFADRGILVEGPTERLLLPKMIEKMDAALPDDKKLGSKYLSIIEVGGAYAHNFFNLLDFLRLRTLVVTDLDTCDASDENKKCRVSKGTHSSNACINKWYAPVLEENSNRGRRPKKEDILAKNPEQKACKARRIAFQIPEAVGYPCGRSFEDAFMLANPDQFGLAGSTPEDLEEKAWKAAKDVDKTDFALKYAIEMTGWKTPRYIEEGLRWLAESPHESVPGAEPAESAQDEVPVPEDHRND